MMQEFATNSHISFEGSLENLNLNDISGYSTQETNALKRKTVSPELDFIVVPLIESTVNLIWKELNAKDHLVKESLRRPSFQSHFWELRKKRANTSLICRCFDAFLCYFHFLGATHL